MAVLTLPLHVQHDIQIDADLYAKIADRLCDPSPALQDAPVALSTACYRPEDYIAGGEIEDDRAIPAVILQDGEDFYTGDIHDMRDSIQDRVAGLSLMLRFGNLDYVRAIGDFYSSPDGMTSARIDSCSIDVFFMRRGLVIIPTEVTYALFNIVSAPSYFVERSEWIGRNTHAFPYAAAGHDRGEAITSMSECLLGILTRETSPLIHYKYPRHSSAPIVRIETIVEAGPIPPSTDAVEA